MLKKWEKNALKFIKIGAKASINKQIEVFLKPENIKAYKEALKYTKI